MEELELYELYYLILVDNIHNDNLIPYDMKSIWDEIKKRYYKENNMLLDIDSDNDIKVLFAWLKDKSRYKLLDYLMLKMVDRFINIESSTIDNRDTFFLNNLSMIYDVLNIQTKRIINNINIDEL